MRARPQHGREASGTYSHAADAYSTAQVQGGNITAGMSAAVAEVWARWWSARTRRR